MGKTIGIIMAVVVVAIMFPIVMDSITDAQTTAQLDTFAGSVVAAGATDVVLTEDLYEDRVGSVSALTATGAGAVPIASTYTAATNPLHITGLGADTPQDITVNYVYDSAAGFTGLSAFMRLTPLLMWLALIVAILGGGFMFVKGKFGNG